MIDRNKFESLEDALRSVEDLDAIQRALSRETVIRNVMKESGESREVIAEQVDAAISMDQEELLKIAHGNPTTLREGLEQLYEKWLTDGVPDGAEYELSMLLDYPFPGEEDKEK